MEYDSFKPHLRPHFWPKGPIAIDLPRHPSFPHHPVKPTYQTAAPGAQSCARCLTREMSDTNSGIPKIDGVSYASAPFKKKENLGVSKLGFLLKSTTFSVSITNAWAPNHLYWHQGRPEMVRSAMQSWQGGTKTSSRRTAGSSVVGLKDRNLQLGCLTWDLGFSNSSCFINKFEFICIIQIWNLHEATGIVNLPQHLPIHEAQKLYPNA